jgi:hypothetical protein
MHPGDQSKVLAAALAEPGGGIDMARMIRSLPVLVALLVLSGCEKPLGPGQDAAALAALPTSRACVPDLPPFGRWKYPGERFTTYSPAGGTMIVGDDGGWCQIQFDFAWGDQPLQAPLRVIQPPEHGQVMVGSVGLSLRIAYKPAPDFAGADSFTVHLTAPDPWDIPVHITVVR